MAIENIEWVRFHDATLVAMTIEWESGDTCIRVRLSEAPGRGAEIHVAGSSLFHCPRKHPWGPSESINDVRVSPIEGGRKRLEMEIQSGDVIEIEGDAIEVIVDG